MALFRSSGLWKDDRREVVCIMSREPDLGSLRLTDSSVVNMITSSSSEIAQGHKSSFIAAIFVRAWIPLLRHCHFGDDIVAYGRAVLFW
jgi:hypothetical protein